MKLLLTKNDYQFIEYICKKYKVSKGKNHERQRRFSKQVSEG